MWLKPNEFKSNYNIDKSDVITASNVYESRRSDGIKSSVKWCGIGVIKYPDGSFY